MDSTNAFERIHTRSAILIHGSQSHRQHRGSHPNGSTSRIQYVSVQFPAISACLSNVNWPEILANNDINSKLEEFYKVAYSIIRDKVPTRVQRSYNLPRWYTAELRDLVFTKKEAHKKWKTSNLPRDYVKFKELRAKCIRKSRVCFRNYIEKVEYYSRSNIKAFWAYLNNLKKSNELPCNMSLGDKTADSGSDIANLFASHFKSVYSHASAPAMSTSLPAVHTLDSLSISFTDIAAALGDVKGTTSPGPDMIPAIFVKSCASSLLEPLSIIFNSSLTEGIFPNTWKKSYITPIYKSGNKHLIQNYRPISIISTIPKLFDAIVANKLSDFFLHKIISTQHGFIRGRSTVSNLLVFTEFVRGALDSSTQVDAIYLDFSKAFDTVNHGRLISKLGNLGICGSLLQWLNSFLLGRTQSVRIKGFLSSDFAAPSGVPQGSHLGPLLFIVFINDICDKFNFVHSLLYADDLKLYASIKSPLDASKVQRDLDALLIWCNENHLFLNIEKCKVMRFRRNHISLNFDYNLNGLKIDQVSSIKDLGILINESLSFDEHLQVTVKKASKQLGFLIRSTRFFKDTKAIINIYKSLVMPILVYGSPIWSPYTDIKIRLLNSVQRKFLRYLSRKTDHPLDRFCHDFHDLSKEFNIPTIDSVHNFKNILLARNILYGNINCPQITQIFSFRPSTYPIRNQRPLLESNSRTNFVFFSTTARLRRSWNALPNSIQSTTSTSLFILSCKSRTLQFHSP